MSRANFVQLLQFHLFVQCSRFISVFDSDDSDLSCRVMSCHVP